MIRRLQDMIRIDTTNPPGNELELAEYVSGLLSQMGLETEIQNIRDSRANVLGLLKGEERQPTLLFNGHSDVVPAGEGWMTEPFSPVIQEGRLYARGSSDMKGGLACLMEAVDVLKEAGARLAGDLLLAFTAGEEVDSSGAWHLQKSGKIDDVEAVVIGKNTGMKIYASEKGALWLKVTTRGKSAHGA